jgi:Protein of unknown function (DUF1761)
MLKVNYWAVAVAAVIFFVIGAVWYSPMLFGNAYMRLRGINPDAMTDSNIPIGEIVGEFVRGLVVAYVLARLLVLLGVNNWLGAAQLGIWLWIGFPAMVLMSSVIHENVPWQLAAIHAGDWLVKILLMAVILDVWRR